MSKKRELLMGAVEWMQELKYVYADARDSGDRVLLELIADINKIENLLTQPEQEPVAWMYEWDTTTTGQPTCKYVNMGKDKPNVEANFLARNFIPLYTAPPKREPLSDEERQRLSKAYSTQAEQVAFEEGIIFAEISYGIGGEE